MVNDGNTMNTDSCCLVPNCCRKAQRPWNSLCVYNNELNDNGRDTSGNWNSLCSGKYPVNLGNGQLRDMEQYCKVRNYKVAWCITLENEVKCSLGDPSFLRKGGTISRRILLAYFLWVFINKLVKLFLMDGFVSRVFFQSFCRRLSRHDRDRHPLSTSVTVNQSTTLLSFNRDVSLA